MGGPIVRALSSIVSSGWVMLRTGDVSVWPYTIVNGAPSSFSNVRTSCSGTSDPPELIALSDDRSVVPKAGCSIRAMSIVGTPIIPAAP